MRADPDDARPRAPATGPVLSDTHDPADERRHRRIGAAVGLALLALAAAPLARGPDYDSFPFSSYPMFARGRPDAAGTVGHVVALSDAGRRRRPNPPPHLGSDEVLQSMMTIAAAIRQGRAGHLCRQVAARVAADPAFRDYAWLEVASDRYDALVYFAGDRRPLHSDPHARCRIPR